MGYGKSEDAAPTPIAPGESAVVTLSIPCSPEYVGTARLCILGIASRMGFTYDQVEDIRLAVGEACANAIERTAGASEAYLKISSHVEAAKLTIEIQDPGPDTTAASAMDTERPASEIDGMNSLELGALLMEILVDEVSVQSLETGGSLVRLTKYANEN